MKLMRTSRALFLAAAMCAVAVPQVVAPHVSAAGSTVSGKVFNDKNSNGVLDSGEATVAGVVVTAYNSSGVVVGTATTGSDGAYSITTSTTTGQVRVEFKTPAGYQSSFAGNDNGTSIQFATLPATNINYALIVPGNYCADNAADPLVATGCQYPGVYNSAGTTNNVANSKSVSYTSWTARPEFSGGLKNGETGSIWGIAYQNNTGLVWSSASVRRHSGLGPNGLGGVYVSSPALGLVTSFDLSSYMTLSADNSQWTNAARNITADRTLSLDAQAFGGVGKVGIGDIEMSNDGTSLYVMNLYERKIYKFPVGGDAYMPTLGTPTSWAVTDPGCANVADVRPWALRIYGDDVYVGVVCSNETASATSFTVGNPAGVSTAPGSGYIRKYSTATSTWSTVKSISFAYQRSADIVCGANANVSTLQCQNGLWRAWTDNFAAMKAAATAGSPTYFRDGSRYTFAQPIIMGLDKTADGSWIVGVSDRLSRQIGAVNMDPTDTVSNANPNGSLTWITAWTTGDTLLICNTGTLSSPTLVQENDGRCGSRTAAAQTESGLSNNSPYREFFFDSLIDTGPDHLEITQGAVLVWNSAGVEQLAVTAMDPGWQYFTNGVRWMNLTDGTRSSGTYFRNIYNEWPNAPSNGHANTFGKSSAMADLELVCDRAPVQIGNRVWIDTNKDGIQDPGELSIAGVTVHLYDATGTTLLGTAITNAKGEYYFASNVTEPAAGTGDNVGGGIEVGKKYVIRLDNPANYAAGGPLSGYSLTKALGTSAASTLDTSIDSNATTVASYPQINTLVMLAGVNDHTYDVGFVRGAGGGVSVGNYVWRDLNGDGYQGKADGGIKGAVLSIRTASGQPVTDLSGKLVKSITTKADGKYLFTNLPAGQYTVTISYPRGYIPTTANRSGRGVNSSSVTAKSLYLANGASDLTLDFGVVYRPLGQLPATK